MTYEEKAREWIEENDIKVGDKVKVLREDTGWGLWFNEMNQYAGKTLKCVSISHNYDIGLKYTDGKAFYFPYNVLEKVNDPVNSPSHYADQKIETIDYLESCMSAEQFEGFLIGNALKYLSRYKKKGNPKQDLKKAVWYVNKALEVIKWNV